MTNKTLLAILSIIFVVQLIGIASAVTITSVSSSPSRVNPGENVDISLTLKNNFDYDLKNVLVGLDLKNVPFAPYQQGSERVISELDEDDSESISFGLTALADAASGTYKVPVTISYNSTIKTDYISITINAAPKLDLSYEGTIIKGRNGELSIKVINSGLGEVKLLSMKLEDVPGIKILGEKYVYIGNIESDDYDSSEFKVYVEGNANSILTLLVRLNYQDSLNKNYEEEKTLTIRAYSLEEAQNLGLEGKSNAMMIIGVIGFLALVYILYRIIKKRKRD